MILVFAEKWMNEIAMPDDAENAPKDLALIRYL